MFLQVCVCPRGGGGVVLSQHALQVVSQHALQQGGAIPACLAVGGCYPSMHCRWYNSIPSRGVSWGVPGPGVSTPGGVCPSVMAFCYGLLVWCLLLKVASWYGLGGRRPPHQKATTTEGHHTRRPQHQKATTEGGAWWRPPPPPDPHPRGEIEGDQVQAHTQGGN